MPLSAVIRWIKFKLGTYSTIALKTLIVLQCDDTCMSEIAKNQLTLFTLTLNSSIVMYAKMKLCYVHLVYHRTMHGP